MKMKFTLEIGSRSNFFPRSKSWNSRRLLTTSTVSFNRLACVLHHESSVWVEVIRLALIEHHSISMHRNRWGQVQSTNWHEQAKNALHRFQINQKNLARNEEHKDWTQIWKQTLAQGKSTRPSRLAMLQLTINTKLINFQSATRIFILTARREANNKSRIHQTWNSIRIKEPHLACKCRL